jgi:hypothetical protein
MWTMAGDAGRATLVRRGTGNLDDEWDLAFSGTAPTSVETAPTSVEIDAAFNCTNRGGNQPGGLASGESGPIMPRSGQITVSNVCTSAGSCPDRMTPTFGPTATINVFQRGNLVFSATVPVS